MPRPFLPRVLLVAIGIVALALPLSACGRKGSLDPPPGGYRLEPGVTRIPTSRRGATRPQETSQDYDEQGRPIAPEGPNRSFPLDPLIR